MRCEFCYRIDLKRAGSEIELIIHAEVQSVGQTETTLVSIPPLRPREGASRETLTLMTCPFRQLPRDQATVTACKGRGGP